MKRKRRVTDREDIWRPSTHNKSMSFWLCSQCECFRVKLFLVTTFRYISSTNHNTFNFTVAKAKFGQELIHMVECTPSQMAALMIIIPPMKIQMVNVWHCWILMESVEKGVTPVYHSSVDLWLLVMKVNHSIKFLQRKHWLSLCLRYPTWEFQVSILCKISRLILANLTNLLQIK